MDIELLGDSMTPLIQHKDIIRVNMYPQPIPRNTSHVGKILLFNDSNEWISHRLIQHKNNLLFKGDYSLAAEDKSELLVWGEVTEVFSDKKRINPNIFSGLISKFSYLHYSSKNKFIRKTFKSIVFILNKINRLFLFKKIKN